MPVDINPRFGGTIELQPIAEAATTAAVVPSDPMVKRHVSHFATCPNANKHRKNGSS